MKSNTPINYPVWPNELISSLATKNELAKFKDDILTAVDEVLGEIQDSREEQTLIAHRFSEHTDTLENHETKISKLETSPLQ